MFPSEFHPVESEPLGPGPGPPRPASGAFLEPQLRRSRASGRRPLSLASQTPVILAPCKVPLGQRVRPSPIPESTEGSWEVHPAGHARRKGLFGDSMHFPGSQSLFREAWIQEPKAAVGGSQPPGRQRWGQEKPRTLVPSRRLCSDSFGTDSPERQGRSHRQLPLTAGDFGASRVTWREGCLPIPL